MKNMSRTERVVTSAAVWLAAAGMVLGACSGGGRVPGQAPAVPGPAVTTASPTPTVTPEPTPITADDVTLGVKVLDKECFGSAGCNVSYQVTLRVSPEIRSKIMSDGRNYSITFEVTGDEDGPEIGTLDVAPDGTYTGEEEHASTPRNSTKLRVKPVSVDMRPY